MSEFKMFKNILLEECKESVISLNKQYNSGAINYSQYQEHIQLKQELFEKYNDTEGLNLIIRF